MMDIAIILTQPKEDEYVGSNGLLHCAKCHTPRQIRREWMGKPQLIRCLCHCQSEARQKAEEARRAAELRDRISRYRSVGMTEKSLRTATFENDRYGGHEIDVAKKYVAHWKEMREDAIGLILWGPVGTGKTYIAACIANALLDQGVPVLMTSMGKLLAGMPSVISENQNEYIQNLNAFDLLIIDDLGAERDTEYASEQVYNIIDARYRAHLPMIFTTNLMLEALRHPKQLSKQRIYSRVLERCVPLNVNRRAIREENAVKTLQRAQEILNRSH